MRNIHDACAIGYSDKKGVSWSRAEKKRKEKLQLDNAQSRNSGSTVWLPPSASPLNAKLISLLSLSLSVSLCQPNFDG